ncbi:putative nacht and wd domain-containing protein [Phaeoacremonium minimum UCRPA7]|uniref:Putative nacht and wd domain-containing protein n=1 Tax=Phaeoacremonium minimum (strain UCR-PA7) TaxID=1286976 RepID=R8BKJ9_PHAM7|nr:putative nacht and wd domain-containing protein [Phaeoacremonium minimum UCRPA7]EON99809.1 putative nacht and wd domain-containing protein [Phaeoacremonium minimum UCRPA7]
MTSITYGPYPQYFACGQDDGSVTIYDIANGKKVRKVYNHANIAAVITLNWSPTGKYMASSDDNGRVIVKRLEQKGEDGKWAVFPCLDFRDQEPANEFCFNYNEKLVLISFPASDRVWNLKTKTQIWRRDREPDLEEASTHCIPISWRLANISNLFSGILQY